MLPSINNGTLDACVNLCNILSPNDKNYDLQDSDRCSNAWQTTTNTPDVSDNAAERKFWRNRFVNSFKREIPSLEQWRPTPKLVFQVIGISNDATPLNQTRRSTFSAQHVNCFTLLRFCFLCVSKLTVMVRVQAPGARIHHPAAISTPSPTLLLLRVMHSSSRRYQITEVSVGEFSIHIQFTWNCKCKRSHEHHVNAHLKLSTPSKAAV